VFNGTGLVWGDTRLHGPVGYNPNRYKMPLPLGVHGAIRLMESIVFQALPDNVDRSKVTSSKRGVLITDMGKRNYDIIPSFMVKDGEKIWHLIPSNDGCWFPNPTTEVLAAIRNLNLDFPREDSEKIISFIDMIRLLKDQAKLYKWKQRFKISSFIIKNACIECYITQNCSRFNHKQYEKVMGVLSDYIGRGFFYDQVEKRQQPLTGDKQALLACALCLE